jgi:hypothetical protein
VGDCLFSAVVIDLSAKDWYECFSLVLEPDFFSLYRWENLLLVRVAGPRYHTTKKSFRFSSLRGPEILVCRGFPSSFLAFLLATVSTSFLRAL